MGRNFTTRFLAAALILLVLAGAYNAASGQAKMSLFRTGNQAAKNPHSSSAKINALVSKPGNSQDFLATSSGNWQLQTQSTYLYNTQGRLLSRYYTLPNSNQNIAREFYSYDLMGNEAEYRKEQWNGTAWNLVDGYRIITTYNSIGNKTEIIYGNWDHLNGVWVKGDRVEIAYDTNNLMTSLTYSTWFGTAWKLSERVILNNTGGVATSTLMQQHNGTTWEDVNRMLNLTWHVLYEIPLAYEMEFYYYNTWVKEEKYAAVYDQNGGHVGTSQSWTGSTWQNSLRVTESYDFNRNYTGRQNETWSIMTNAWETTSAERQILTYSGIDITERIFQDSQSYAPGVLQDRAKEVYSNFQSFTISGINKTHSEKAVNVYPNPAINIISIDFPENSATALTATLSDITGKTWLTENFKADQPKQLNMESLPKGIFLLQLKTAKGTSVQKVVKQ
ncbi:T9SS type A sorting domain-containing protein [Adhaeribacter soli]|uniref:T9SS type A sorting domain-containing protein n=1 Tax=Adhaeribacter soli TaxID=2607655 RepID=A0A5N1J337_9BACT|nr:T9SS type A sorting domain-containing protein [Adhaeribacter soli]KAA9340942.1 T9SS type A sorting domain-containing protein [Adhaeribacter soli]